MRLIEGFIWDYTGENEHTFIEKQTSKLQRVDEYVYCITFEGYGSVLLSLSQRPASELVTIDPYPYDNLDDTTIKLNHVQYWTVEHGVVSPFHLSLSIATRKFPNLATKLYQDLDLTRTGTYALKIIGAATIKFIGADEIEWSTNAEGDTEDLDSETVYVSFTNILPTRVEIILKEDDHVYSLSMSHHLSLEEEQIKNHDFTNVTTSTYTLQQWDDLTLSKPKFITFDMLGWVTGFYTTDTHTIFSDDIEPSKLDIYGIKPEDRLPLIFTYV